MAPLNGIFGNFLNALEELMQMSQRWANSVLMTEYEYEYYLTFQKWPNTNTNIIWFEKITRIWMRILVLGLNYSNNIQIPNYSLTSASHGGHHHIIHGVPHTNVIRFEEKSWPNTNTNIIRFENIDRIRIRILFGLKKSTEYEYEYYSVWKYQPNTNTNIIRLEKITQIWIRILVFGLNFSNNIWIPKYSLTSALEHNFPNSVCSFAAVPWSL